MAARKPPEEKATPRRAKILFAEHKAAPVAQGPKILFGASARTRIPCSTEALRALDTSADGAVLKQALKVVAQVNLDDMYFEDVVKFGARLQAEHAAITQQELALARASPLPRAQALHIDILRQLRALEPDKVFGLRENWAQRFWRRLFGGNMTVEQVFSQHYPRVEALAKDLDALEPELTRQLADMAALGRRYEALDIEVSGYILAVRYISNYVHGEALPPEKQALYINHIDAITERKDSLRLTRVTLSSGQLNLELTIKNIERLIAAGRRLLDQTLPSFQTAYTVAINASRKGNTGKTGLRTLRGSYRDLLENISQKEP